MSEPSFTRLYRGVFLVALATLLFELAVIRVLSFTIWHHFAYVAISTALLGYAAAGTFVAVRPRIGRRDLEGTLSRACLLAALSAAAALLAIAAFPLHPMQIFARPSQLALLISYQLGVAVPFFFSGIAVSLALRTAASRVDRLYCWDLVGGGLGCAAAVSIMNALSPPGAALVAAGVFALAAAAFAPAARLRATGIAAAVVLVAAAPLGAAIPFTPAQSKHLAYHMQQGMKRVFSDWSALFRTDVLVQTEGATPLTRKDEWGLSQTQFEGSLPLWGFITHDGTAGAPAYDLSQGPPDFLDYHVLRLPYLVAKPRPRVLVIGVGAGRDVFTALHFGASSVTGVELDPITVKFIEDDPYGISEGLFQRPEVKVWAGEGRHFVRRTDQDFDMIQITAVDTLAAQGSGAYVLAENYVYTVEAFHDYLDRLAPGGVLSIAAGNFNSGRPRSTGRMVSTLRETLLERGIERPQDHIVAITSLKLLAEVIAKETPFTPEEIARLDAEARRLEFAPLLLPGRSGHPVFENLASAEGEARQAVLAGLPYLVHPVHDDSPFFFRFFRWRDLLRPGELDPNDLGPVHSTALGQIVLLVLLVSLTILGGILVLGPLVMFRRRLHVARGAAPLGILVYFTAIGLGFMLFEISLLQRFILYLGYPTYSLSVVLLSLLISLGLGSLFSRRWVGRERVVLPLGVLGVALLTLFYLFGLPIVQEGTLGASLAVRVSLSVAMLLPLGLVLGAFLPLGVRRAERVHEDMVPWAWGVNGCASVTGAVLTVVLAMTFGFERVWLLSLLIYAGGVATLLATGRNLPAPEDG